MLTQVVLNGLIASCTILVTALGFSLALRVAKFLNFAYGALFTVGAYLVIAFNMLLGPRLFVSIPLAIIGATLVGCAIELFVFRPLRRRGASGLILLIASLGVYVVLQNVISVVFGDDTKRIGGATAAESIIVLGGYITPVQLAIVCTSLLLLSCLIVLLRWTQVGKAMRAVASAPDLAAARGIHTDQTVLLVTAIGSASAAIAGILVALDVGLTPTMGLRALMLAVVAVIVGGVGSMPGALLGALVLGMIQHIGVWKVGSQWQDAIAFAILFVFLLARPQGFFGHPLRKAAI